MKKTLLFIAAMLGCIMVSSLTSCGDESIEDVPETSKDTTENKNPYDIYADSYISLRVMKYSSTGYVQTVILSQGGKPTSYFGMPVLFHHNYMKDFTYYEGDTLNVIVEYPFILVHYPEVPDSLQDYVREVYPYGSTPVRPLFKNVSSVYYLADGFFNVELLKKHNGSYVWRAVVNRIPDKYTGSMVVVHDTINSFIIPNNIDDSYPMSVGDTLCVRLARYVSSLGETTDWTVKGLDDTHRTITKTLFGHFGY